MRLLPYDIAFPLLFVLHLLPGGNLLLAFVFISGELYVSAAPSTDTALRLP